MIVFLFRKLNRYPTDVGYKRFLLNGLLFLTVFLGYLQPVYAQTQPKIPSYWQYAASGRLLHVVPADMDADGVDEFLIADENGRVDLIGASGRQQWSYTAAGPIMTISPINVDGPDHPQLEVVIGVSDQMILLSADGEEIWQTNIGPNITSSPSIPGGAQETAGNWLDENPLIPAAIIPFDRNADGLNEILVLLQTGYLLLYDTQGNLLWQLADYATNPSEVEPKIHLFDFDQDGQNEILLSVFNPRRFGQLVLVDDEEVRWEIPLSGRITDLEDIRFSDGSSPLIAASTSLGQVHVYDYLRRQHWFRTLNRPATKLASFPLPEGSALAVGTSVGTVVAFDQDGHRLWESKLAENADREILALSASTTTPSANQPLLAATLQADDRSTNAADVVLLSGSGQVYSKISEVGSQGLTRFVDSNRDLNNELMIAHFATLELLGLGVGNNENVREWEYSLDAAPSAALVIDLDGDAEEELVIGTRDGRVHSLNSDRTIRWLHDVGGAISNLAVLPADQNRESSIVVVRHDEPNAAGATTWIELRESKGERIWEQQLDSTVSSLIVANIDQSIEQEIIAGTEDGRVIVFTADGEILWDILVEDLAGGIQELLVLGAESDSKHEIIAGGTAKLVGIDLTDELQPVRDLAIFEYPILDIFAISSSENPELDVRLLVTTGDGAVHGLNVRGIEMAHLPWPQTTLGVPAGTIIANNTPRGFQPVQQSLLMSTDLGRLIRLDVENNIPSIPWQIENQSNITALHWRDQDKDGQPDLAVVGNDMGQVWVYSQLQSTSPQTTFSPLELNSSIFALETFQRDTNQPPGLLAVTENGLVQLFREQENLPPLLTEPAAKVEQGQYTIGVIINDVEGDEVAVQLEVFDPQTGQWIQDELQIVDNGSGTLFWPLAAPPDSPEGLHYRFVYNDGSYQGRLVPPPGPPSIVPSPWASAAPALILSMTAVGLIFTIIFIRQAQTPNAQARRFYRRLRQQPARSLILLEKKYLHTNGSPDFLLHLANRARHDEDRWIANLADGLFLLPDRPQAGLSIMNRTLDEIAYDQEWEELERWQMTYGTTQALLDAPSVAELSLLRPQLLQLLEMLESREVWSPVLNVLRPVISNLYDSERVELAEDRLVYLNEAAARLMQTKEWLPDYSPSIENTVVAAIIRRWSGIVTAEIEDLRGRAQLSVVLKTKRLIPSDQTIVALDILNSGRSAAENIIAILGDDPAYSVQSSPQEIPFLPPGRTVEVRFGIEPHVIDRFRISLSLTYDDRSNQNITLAFGDMVHLLPPVREFNPVDNPYTPGTPLRPGSLLFFGREDLFEFIAENAGYRAFRNVLILVGQRRTGKTSALLRLEDHLPAHLMPVYIDCQSLGVIPGMPALLEELAWYIADALALRDITVTVPELEQWQKDPTHLFQRRFLPQVKELLPPDTTLLLVFDEFEAFENLVADGILPPTFFTYLRHLMQHGEQLNFIFVGTRRLEEMTSDYWSVLFNIALYRKIDFLTVDAATHLITEPVAPNLIYDDLAIDKILRVTAGHPYFLQLVCYTLVKRANKQQTGYVTISDVNAAVDEMLSLGEVHFAYIWQRSSATERALLTAVAHLMDRNAPFYPEDLILYLQPYAVELDPQSVTTALNHLVERDILREVTEEVTTLYELKLGLVGLWIAKNKSLSKLFAGNGSSESPKRTPKKKSH